MTRRPPKPKADASVPLVEVGQVDPMSSLAVGLPQCGKISRPGDRRPCTRIHAHDEHVPGHSTKAHPARLHVHAPRPDYIALATWRNP